MFHSWAQSLGLLILRVSFGGLMLAGHGIDKLLNFSEKVKVFPDPIGLGAHVALGLATFAEFFCAVLLILGLGTRLASIPLIVTMLVAAVSIHGSDPWAKKELAVAFLAAFTTILITGPGGFALDRFFFMGRRSKK